eukprot:2486315-Prorocentrum_lima.AAC.1
MQAYIDNMKTYSGIATKCAQRVVNAFAAQNNYVLFRRGISAVFLKGMTFEELAKDTGGKRRS